MREILHPLREGGEGVENPYKRRYECWNGPDEPLRCRSKPKHHGTAKYAQRNAEQEEHKKERDEYQAVTEEGETEYRGRQDEHHDESHAAGCDAREYETTHVLGYRKGCREEIEEIARPHIFEEGRRHSLHDANRELPQENCSQECRDEIEAGRGDGVEISSNEAPQHHVDSDPRE